MRKLYIIPQLFLYVLFLLVLSSFVCAATAFPYPYASNQYNATYYWPMDEGDSADRVDKINGHILFNVGSVTNGTGVYDGAADFDSADDFINETPADAEWNSGNWSNFTIAFWHYSDNHAGDEVFVYLGAGAERFRAYFSVNNSVDMYHGPGACVDLNLYSGVTTNATQWTHYIFILDNTNATMYINGDTKYTEAYACGLDDNPDKSSLEFGEGGYDTNSVGLVDEVLIFNRTITEAEALKIYTSNWYYFNYSLTYNSSTTETRSESYLFNISHNTTDSFITSTNFSANLTWNGTDYPATPTIMTDYTLFNVTLTMPEVSTNTNVTLNWTYTFYGVDRYDFDRNIIDSTDSYNITIADINFDDCSTYTVVALNFTMMDEKENETINGSMEFFFELTSGGLTMNYSKALTDHNNTAFCISGDAVNFTNVDLQAGYSATNFDLHTYYMTGNIVDNVTDFITLYLTNGTTTSTFTVVDEYGDRVQDVYIKILLWDIGTGSFKTISILKTDTLGQAVGQIILDTSWYKFILEYNGLIVGEDGPLIMTTNSRTFRIRIGGVDYSDIFDSVLGISTTLTFENTTKDFVYTFSDPTGSVVEGCLKVVNKSVVGETIMFDNCTTSTAASIYVSIGIDTNTSTFIGTGYVKDSDANRYITDVLGISFADVWTTYNLEGVFFSFLIVTTIVMAGLFHPAAAIILAVVGLIFTSLLGFYQIAYPILATIVALGIVAAIMVSRSR